MIDAETRAPKITPEMIEAGAMAISGSPFFAGGPSAAEALAEEVFANMLAADQRGKAR